MRPRDTGQLRRERWERENAAPRLKQLVPHLAGLRLGLVESRGGYAIGGTRRVQHVVLDTASARFEVPCGEKGCTGGGHDLSRTAASQLRNRRTAFNGTSECTGSIGDRRCDRRLEYSFEATYSDRT